MKRELLVETYTPRESKIIAESVTEPTGKNVYLCGRFLSGEQKNKNGRIYPLSEIAKAVDSLNEMIKDHGSVLGECDHPLTRLQTSMKERSHVITEIHLDGNNAIGKMKIMNTPNGLIIKEIIRSGFRPDVSARGSGVVNTQGIVEDYVIQSIDCVIAASGIGCSPQSIVESIEGYKQANKILTLAEAVKEDKSAQKYFTKEINKFIESLIK